LGLRLSRRTRVTFAHRRARRASAWAPMLSQSGSGEGNALRCTVIAVRMLYGIHPISARVPLCYSQALFTRTVVHKNESAVIRCPTSTASESCPAGTDNRGPHLFPVDIVGHTARS
jgi:hypothetical protein